MFINFVVLEFEEEKILKYKCEKKEAIMCEVLR